MKIEVINNWPWKSDFCNFFDNSALTLFIKYNNFPSFGNLTTLIAITYTRDHPFKALAFFWWGGGGTVGFYADISWESRCNIEINVWPHLWNFVSFWSTLSTPSQRDTLKKLKLPASNLTSFNRSHICVKQIGLESARTLKKY